MSCRVESTSTSFHVCDYHPANMRIYCTAAKMLQDVERNYRERDAQRNNADLSFLHVAFQKPEKHTGYFWRYGPDSRVTTSAEIHTHTCTHTH